VRLQPQAAWELYDLAADPSESNNVAAAHPDKLEQLVTLATQAHQPAVEGTFARTDRHERDRRAKFGQHDQPATMNPKNAKQRKKTAVMPKAGMLSNQNWRIVRVSSENGNNERRGRHAIDGDPNTHWHTQFSPVIAPPPHELVIDLGAEHTLRGFIYLARQDDGWNGAIKEVEIAVSSTPDLFPAPLIKSTLLKTKEPQALSCSPTVGRYVLLRAHSEHGMGRFASVAELGIMGE
jgi:hypothetical protein